MPTVPVAQNRVGIAEVSGAKLQAADYSGTGLQAVGAGMQQLGQTGARVAEEQDRLAAKLDDAGAKTIDVEAMARLSDIQNRFLAERGLNAGNARAGAEKELADAQSELMARATTPRMKQMLSNILAQRVQSTRNNVDQHVRAQMTVAEDTASEARWGASAETAVAALNPDDRDRNIDTGLGEIETYAARRGLDPAVVSGMKLKYTSGIHSDVARGMIDADNIDGALAYREKHKSEISADDEGRLDSMLRAPLQRRETNAGVAQVFGQAPSGSATDEAPAVGRSAMFATIVNIEGGTDKATGKFRTSPKGAVGPAQVMPGTGPEAAKLAGLAWDEQRYRSDPAYNLKLGEAYFNKQLQTFGDPAKAAAAYNAGPGSAAKGTGLRGAMAKAQAAGRPDAWQQYLPAETRAYVDKFRQGVGVNGPQQGPQRLDLNELLARTDKIADAENWSPEKRDRVKDAVTSKVNQNDMLLSRQQADAYDQSLLKADQLGDDFTDTAQLGPAFEQASPEQQHTLTSRARANAEAVREKTEGLSNFNAMMATPGFAWNPYDAAQKQSVEAAVKAAGGSPQAALDVWQRTGILAKSGAVALRGGLVSTDPQAVQVTANIAGNMVRRNPNAFAGIDGGEDMERAAFAFNHYTYDLGMSPKDAAKRVAQENTPEFKTKVKVGQPELDAYRKQIRKVGADNAAAALGGAFATTAQAQEANETYAELTIDGLQRGQDLATAQSIAKQQMGRFYGVARNGKLLKYPPEKTYPAIGGSHDYIYRDAAVTVKQETGIAVKPTDLRLVAIPGVTDDDARNGRAARYRILYAHTVKGQIVYDTVPGQFAADTGVAASTASREHKNQFDSVREEARQQAVKARRRVAKGGRNVYEADPVEPRQAGPRSPYEVLR